MSKRAAAEKNLRARKKMECLVDALRERHGVLHDAVEYARMRQEPAALTYQQALHACRYWMRLADDVVDELYGGDSE